MKNLLIASAAALSLMAVPSVSLAQDDVPDSEIMKPKETKKNKDLWIYADASYAFNQFSSSEGNTTYVSDTLTATYFRAGVKYKYFGAEAEYGVGQNKIENKSLGLGSQKSIFAILRAPGEKFDVYLRAGYHSSEFDVRASIFDGATTQTVEETVDSNGFAGGIGGTYFFTNNFGLRADITAYNTRDIADAGFVGGSLGGVVKF